VPQLVALLPWGHLRVLLEDIQKPIGISTYRVTRELPEPLQAEVPSIEDLEGVVEQLRMGFDDARETQDGSGGER
jgi:hypothetical protein